MSLRGIMQDHNNEIDMVVNKGVSLLAQKVA